jgi:hypothetical protein
MVFYIADIKAPTTLQQRQALKNKGAAHLCMQSFLEIALNMSFFLCYFRRRVESADIVVRARTQTSGD